MQRTQLIIVVVAGILSIVSVCQWFLRWQPFKPFLRPKLQEYPESRFRAPGDGGCQPNVGWNFEIYAMNGDGSNVKRLTNNPAWDAGRAAGRKSRLEVTATVTGRSM